MPNVRFIVAGPIKQEMLIQAAGVYAGGKARDDEARKANPDLPALEIDVVVSSYGGDPAAAFAIHNWLRATGHNINTYNAGECSSAATIIFLAGHKRYTSKLSFFKFHPVLWDLGSTGPTAATRIDDISGTIDTLHNLWGQLIKERTKLGEKEIASFFTAPVIFTPEQAQGRGIVHQIKEPPV